MAQKFSGTILISESLGIENTNNFNTKYFNIKQEKMTPIEWLALRYHHRQGYLSQNDIAEAKEMEKKAVGAKNAHTQLSPYELWQLETYGNYYKEDETQHDVEPYLD